MLILIKNKKAFILGKGLKKIVEFSPEPLAPPPPVSGKKIVNNKNDLRVMKRILYDMGPLTHVRWPL